MASNPPMQSDPDILSGISVFRGTRVPVRTLFDYLGSGEPLQEFLNDFPSVTRRQALAVLTWCRKDAERAAHARAA